MAFIIKPDFFKNLLKKPDTEPADISASQFPEVFDKFKENNFAKMVQEFEAINRFGENLSEKVKTHRKALLPSNVSKNRYRNILPFDDTRVILDAEDGETDYINATYVKGYSSRIEYISTQGPTEQTCFDFWRMVWQFSCENIIMLTKLVENEVVKCYQYYPLDSDNVLSFEDISVKCVETVEDENALFTKRTLLIEWVSY